MSLTLNKVLFPLSLTKQKLPNFWASFHLSPLDNKRPYGAKYSFVVILNLVASNRINAAIVIFLTIRILHFKDFTRKFIK